MKKDKENIDKLTQLRNVLENSSLFRGVDFDAIGPLLLDCRVLYLKEGDVLLSKNQYNGNIFVVLYGSFRVSLIHPNELAIASFGEGECIGEMSVIDGRDASASVIAITESSVLQISQDIFWSMINSSPCMSRNLLSILSKRLRVDDDMIIEEFYARQEIEKAAQSDALTSLHNRRWFDDALARQMKRCHEDNIPFCLLILDLDYFKRINDKYGHISGDRALVTVARLLNSQLRPTDMLARYGGEEFVLGLPNTKLDEAFAIAERLRRAIEFLALPFRSGEPFPHLTTSIGVTQMQDDQTPDEIYASADAALYRAKDGGRNRVAI
jgi:diguanylate cyclase (GGDEF)-like protein